MADILLHTPEPLDRNDLDGPGEIQGAVKQSSYQQSTCNVLVLSAMGRQALTAVRSLGKRELQVAIMNTPDEGLAIPAFSSRWCHQKVLCPPTIGAELTTIEQALDATGASVVLPTSDGTVALLRRYRDRLKGRASLAIAQEPALAIAVNKDQTLDVARRLKIRTPRGATLTDGSETEAALKEIGLPAVVKPVESWVEGEKQGIRIISKLVVTPDEARRAVEELTGFGRKVLFQQYLPGKREAVSLIYARGQVYARFAQWARRTNPPLGGVSVLRQSIAIPADIGEQAEWLVREIDLEGYSEVEFRRDNNGYPYLMEINPRLSASVEIAVRAGVDFPSLLYQWANGERIDTVEGYRQGIWMRYLGGDIATTLAAFRQRGRPGVPSPARAICDFCTSFLLPTRYDYFDWRDPLPAWVAMVGFPRALLRQAQASFANRSPGDENK